VLVSASNKILVNCVVYCSYNVIQHSCEQTTSKCNLCHLAVSVAFVNSVKTKKIWKIFFKFHRLVLKNFKIWKKFNHRVAKPYQTAWQYSDGNPTNGGVECMWGRQKSQFWAYIWLDCMLLMQRPASCYQHDDAGPRSRNLWHLSLVVIGGVCWWREMTTKCLWLDISLLRQRQQNSI